jgi:hypothetical protein
VPQDSASKSELVALKILKRGLSASDYFKAECAVFQVLAAAENEEPNSTANIANVLTDPIVVYSDYLFILPLATSTLDQVLRTEEPAFDRTLL